MIQTIRNFGVFLLAFFVALVGSLTLYLPWHNALIGGRSFSVVLGIFSGITFLSSLFYLLFFILIWMLPAALLRTAKPVAWAVVFGLAVSAARELCTGHSVSSLEPSFFYARSVVEALFNAGGAVLGCLLAVALVSRLKQSPPNYSLKRTDQSLRD